MTNLPAIVSGRWFHLYLILDLYSRKIVGWEVHDKDDSEHAVHLVHCTALAEGIAAMATKPIRHGDNGSTLKATTVLAMLNRLGVKPSYSRPRVSDDNAYAESLFRTAKLRPEFPTKGFASLAFPRPAPATRPLGMAAPGRKSDCARAGTWRVGKIGRAILILMPRLFESEWSTPIEHQRPALHKHSFAL